MRVGQALGLRHEDFVSRQRLVRIVPRDDNPNGARAKTSRTHELCVSGELVRRYSDYMVDEYGALDTDFVFVNLWGRPYGSPMTRSGVNELTRALRARTGIGFTPHMLRHTNATGLQRLGVPLEVISRRLCHANLTTTATIYIHLTLEETPGARGRRVLEPGLMGPQSDRGSSADCDLVGGPAGICGPPRVQSRRVHTGSGGPGARTPGLPSGGVRVLRLPSARLLPVPP
jgi:Phage integrase family